MIDIRQLVMKTFISTVEESGGTVAHPIDDRTVLLESGLDSLGFAVLVSRLEDELGYDPFSLSPEAYYPSTFGEFINFYEQNKPT